MLCSRDALGPKHEAVLLLSKRHFVLVQIRAWKYRPAHIAAFVFAWQAGCLHRCYLLEATTGVLLLLGLCG